jgi:hypothetical protein
MLKTKKRNNKHNNKHNKKTKRVKKIPNKTEKEINILSQNINNEIVLHSYSPTINKELVTLRTINREPLIDCNNKKAFQLLEPLKINISKNKCVPYYLPEAKKFLLKNLSANKHVNPNQIVPPIQSLANCWFNTMFVTLFVSDKGRKFFHFFRQLMIEGKQSNNSIIPKKLQNGFALLNYAIDSCLTGNKYAYLLDTNSIIKQIYDNIPLSYKITAPYLTNVNEAGNPIRYYECLINYLHNKSLQMLFLSNANETWLEQITKEVKEDKEHLPHFIVIEIFDAVSKEVTNKSQSFYINKTKYMLDSAIIRDTQQQHFCATLTCNKKEMAYDGMSFHRLVPMNWKNNINKNNVWSFEGTNNLDGTPLTWNFLNGYQMLVYYRI